MNPTQLLNRHHIRPTPIRRQILLFLESDHLLSADQMVAKLKTQHIKADRVTVYRTLELLNQKGLVCTHHFGQNQAKYELRLHHHDHLICNHCGTVESADLCQNLNLNLPPDFQSEHHHLDVYGLCLRCRESKS